MTVQFSPEFKENLSVFIDYFQKEDEYQGSTLVQEFQGDLLNTIETVKDFPDAFPEFIPRIRRISLKKFKNHCLRYSYNSEKEILTFLTIKHYAQNS